MILRVHFIFFLHPIYYPRTSLALLPSSSSDPGSHSGPCCPLPATVRDFSFIARRIQHFSSLVDWRRIVPTRAARRSQQLTLSFCIFANTVKPHHDGGNRTLGRTLVVFEGDHQTTGATGNGGVKMTHDVHEYIWK